MPFTPHDVPLDSMWLRTFRRKLRAWYDRHARDLPWRGTRDPYAVWLSEIMLQQTQVETVKPYFQRFLTALPTIRALAEAKERQVLRLWEGLGYYRRGRQLHKAAQVIVAAHRGTFPTDPEAVLGLPGIGRYTAGAILSIAFDQRRPILEANTVRLFSRLLAYDGQPSSAAGQKLLWAAAEAVLPARDVGRFNQALMELGGQVCRPRAPLCQDCPAAGLCKAQLGGLQEEIPRAKLPPRIEEVAEAAVLVRRRGRVLLIQWPEGRRWAGLWDFPRFALQATQPAKVHRELIDNVQRLTGVTISPGEHRQTLRHGVTRFRITLACYEGNYVSHHGGGEKIVQKWVRPAELAHYPLSSTGRKLAALACGRHSG
jgi:A/G-specific adenine glycosylase